ncbi:hypothetical protein B0H34DRAFT_127197 [Crassisporium funariophilum]|nr:hypothetical protein B0H34DRAFT_127197 [Crassisporium funariophilum]
MLRLLKHSAWSATTRAAATTVFVLLLLLGYNGGSAAAAFLLPLLVYRVYREGIVPLASPDSPFPVPASLGFALLVASLLPFLSPEIARRTSSRQIWRH